MELTTLLFNEATIKKSNQKYSSNDNGYKVTAEISLESAFTPELAKQLRCHENFFTVEDHWRDGVTSAGLPVVIDNVRVELREIEALKKAGPVFELDSVGMETFNVFDSQGAPRMSFKIVFEKDIAGFVRFMCGRKFFHGNVHAIANQDALDFGRPSDNGGATSLQDGDQPELDGTAPTGEASHVYDTGTSAPVSKALKAASGKKASAKKEPSKKAAPKKKL